MKLSSVVGDMIPSLNKLSLVLVGLGNIAYKYDYLRCKTYDFLGSNRTHYAAALKNGFEILGGVDSSTEARFAFEKFSNRKTWESVSQIPQMEVPKIFVICSPPETHLSVITEILECFRPLGLICEKPLGSSHLESDKIIKMTNNSNVPILVNYTRQFSAGYETIKKFFNLENFISGHFVYSHGLRRNASHFIRLILGILGEPIEIRKLNMTGSVEAISFSLQYSNNRHFDFFGVSGDCIQIGEGFIESTTKFLNIYEGKVVKIGEIEKGNHEQLWPRENRLILDCSLSNGLDNLYSNRDWFMNENSRSEGRNSVYFDSMCNQIIDVVLNFSK